MTADLKIVNEDFDAAISSLKSVHTMFESMRYDDAGLGFSVGHAALGVQIVLFNEGWRVKRKQLSEGIEAHAKSLEAVRDTFEKVDKGIGDSMDPGNNGGQDNKDPAPSPSPAPSPGGGTSGGGRNWSTDDYNASPVGGGSSSGGGISDPRTEPAKDPGAVSGTAGPTTTINPTDVVDPGRTHEVTDTTANPDLDPTKYPEVAKLKELLGQAVDVVLESHPDGGVTLRVGSVSGLSLIALTALMARRGKAEAGDGAVNAADAETGAAGALRKALGLVTWKECRTGRFRPLLPVLTLSRTGTVPVRSGQTVVGPVALSAPPRGVMARRGAARSVVVTSRTTFVRSWGLMPVVTLRQDRVVRHQVVGQRTSLRLLP